MNDTPAIGVPPARRKIWLDFAEGEADDILVDLPLGHSVSEATRNLYLRLREARRTPPQGEDVPEPPEHPDIFYAPPQPVRPSPARLPVRGIVVRKVDVTGISGLGHIAEFCIFSDGATAIRWLGGPPQNQPKTEQYDNPGIEPFVQISGHNGNAEIIWIDDEPEP
jgi:hypothetical protein